MLIILSNNAEVSTYETTLLLQFELQCVAQRYLNVQPGNRANDLPVLMARSTSWATAAPSVFRSLMLPGLTPLHVASLISLFMQKSAADTLTRTSHDRWDCTTSGGEQTVT